MPNCSIPGATESTSRTASRLRLATPGLPTASRPARGRTCWSAFTASSANSHPRSIAQKPLDRVDRHRAGQLRSVAHALARVIADPAVNRSQRVVSNQLPPGPFGIAGLQVRQPSLDVLTGRAAGVARRQQIDVHRAMLPNRPSSGETVHEIRQRRDVARCSGHAGVRHRDRGVEAILSSRRVSAVIGRAWL
jgi:hypothetical protein